MNLEQIGIGVVARFFEAFATLAAEHSILEVANTCGFDRRNLYKKRSGEGGMRTIPVAWLSSLCYHYRVSTEWLLLGKGEMFN